MSSSLRPSGGSGSNTKRMVHSPHPARFRQLGLDSSSSRIPSEYNRTSSKSIEDAEVDDEKNQHAVGTSETSELHRQNTSSMDQEEDETGSMMEEELMGEFVTSPYRVRRQQQQPQQRQQHSTTSSSSEVMAKHSATTIASPGDDADADGHPHVEIVGDNSDDFHDVENHHHDHDGRSSSPHASGANISTKAAVDDCTNSSLLMVGRVASLLCMSEAIDDWSIITSSSSSSLSNLCVEKNERQCTRMKNEEEKEEDLNYFICPDCCEVVQLESSAPRLTGTAGGNDSSVARGDVVGNVERGVAVGTAATTSPRATAAGSTIRMNKHHQQSKSQSSKESEDNVFPPALTPLTPMTPPPQPSLREVDDEEDHPMTTRPTFVHFASSGSGGNDATSSHHHHHNADSPSSLMHTPPLALVGSKSYYDSPNSHLLQSGDYYVDGHHHANSRNVTTSNTHLKTRGNIRDIQTNQKRYVSRMIATAVLTNPMSLRSYCSQVAVQEATSSHYKKHNRQPTKHQRHRHRHHHEQDREKVRSKKKLVCSHCHCVFQSTTTTQEDEQQPNYHNDRSMPPQSQDVVVLSSSEATAKKKSAFAKNTNTASTYHRRFHVSKENFIQQLIGTVVNGVLDHIPQVAISFQIISDTTEYSVTIGVSMCHLASMGMTCFLDAIAYLLWETQNVLMEGFHMLNPWVAVDITTDVLTSGIQSVAEGVGSTKKSASAAIQHYLSRGGEKGGKSKKGHVDVLETPFGGAGIPSSSGNNGMNSRSSSRASFLLGIPGVVQVSQALTGGVGGGGKGGTNVQLDSYSNHPFHHYDPTNKVLSEKLFKKLNKIDSTSKVIEYRERYEHEALSSRAKQRVQRMMHYAVSLRPFTATVVAPTRETLLHPSHHLLEQQQQDVITSTTAATPGRLRRSSSANSKKSSPTSTSGKGGSRKGSSSDEQPPKQQQEGARMEVETTTFANIDFVQSPTGSFASIAVGNVEDDDNGEPQPSQRGEQQHHATEAHSTTTPGQASMRAIANRSEVEEATLHSSPDRIVLPGHGSSSSDEDDDTDTNHTGGSTPFLCTPKSFPPTPGSRLMVMARGSRFAEDVVFFAREHLRLQDGLESTNDRTRSMALALRDGRRLAVFSADDAGRNISLSCGQHCATKVGNLLYCTTRCMVPVLRNCYVYFEMSVANPVDHQSASIMPSLSIGLSTTEMPNNTLVGAWKSSIGLLTTGQVLAAGQWYSPCDSRISMYGHASTVGCLVLLDDSKSFETWDGMMVPASITFNVDGILVVPPTYLLPPHLGGMIGAGVLSGTLGGPPGTMNTMSMMTGPGTAAGSTTSNTMPPGSYQSGGVATAAAVGDAATATGSSIPQAAATAAATTSSSTTPTPAIQSPSTTGSFFGLPPTVVPNSSFSLYVPREEDLYATLTLHSPSTQVMCRFCAEDIFATTRESIGAPPGTTIYAVDGSVLFEKVENSRT